MNYIPSNLMEHMPQDLADELGFDKSFDFNTPLLVITGANAAGKSLFRKLIQLFVKRYHDDVWECIHLSQQGRATAGIQRAFIYGSEDFESTGVISSKTFKGAIRTSNSRDHGHIIIWDEPEIGMGEELQLGTAIWLKEKLAEWPGHLRGVILMSHSRIFVEEVMKFQGAKFLHLGDPEMDLNGWLNREITPASPEDVSKLGHERYLKVHKILEKAKKERKEREG